MAFVQTNAQAIHWEEQGQGDPPIVFCHGLLLDRTMFNAQVEHLSSRHRCISWDQRGHGLTREDGTPFDYWDSARDCLAVMDAAGVGSAVLVGLSQGGFLAMRAALLAPERVTGLVLIATQSGIDGDDVNDSFRGLRAEWSANGPLNAGDGVAQMLLGDAGHAAAWRRRWDDDPKERLGPCIDTLIERDDVTPRLGEIRCPTLVIHGEQDGAIPIEKGRALSAAMPESRGLVGVPGAAHAPSITHPHEVNVAIDDFLANIQG